MEITEENTIEELCRQQKGNTNHSFAPEIFEIGMEHQSSKRLAQPSGGIYRRLSFSRRKTNRTSFLAVKARARLCWCLLTSWNLRS